MAIAFYVIGVTFKETAVVFGALYILYFSIELYHGGSFVSYARSVLCNRKSVELLLLLCTMTALLVIYITSAWSNLNQPIVNTLTYAGLLTGIKGLLIFIFDFHVWDLDLTQKTYYANIYFARYMDVVMFSSIIFSASTAYLLFIKDGPYNFSFKKPFIFLFIATLFCLILPLGWGAGNPWHFNLALIMIGLLSGFSFEYIFFQFTKSLKKINFVGILLAVCIGLTTVYTNLIQTRYYESSLPPLYNAVFNPPALKGVLTKDSLLIVEDSLMRNPYAFGAAVFPASVLHLLSPSKYIDLMVHQNVFFVNTDPDFSGSLFKWAYLNANFKEQIVPYRVDHLELVTTSLLYQWLQHYDNVYYITYDMQGNWHDLTSTFKKYLLAEKIKRGLVVRNYHSVNISLLKRKFIRTVLLPAGDVSNSQLQCDQEKSCIVYQFTNEKSVSKCDLYN